MVGIRGLQSRSVQYACTTAAAPDQETSSHSSFVTCPALNRLLDREFGSLCLHHPYPLFPRAVPRKSDVHLARCCSLYQQLPTQNSLACQISLYLISEPIRFVHGSGGMLPRLVPRTGTALIGSASYLRTFHTFNGRRSLLLLPFSPAVQHSKRYSMMRYGCRSIFQASGQLVRTRVANEDILTAHVI